MAVIAVGSGDVRRSEPSGSGRCSPAGDELEIVGVSRVLVHEGNAREILKGLLKLLAHGARQGW